MPFDLDPAFDREMDALFDRADEAMAKAAVAYLVNVMDRAGTGQKWPGLPNTSSAPGQYPVVQSRALIESLDARRLGSEWHFGSFNAPDEAWALEYPKPEGSPIDRKTPHGARPWLSKLLGDPEAHRAIWDALDSTLGR
ncbi:hypothetical protein [Deinococcus sp. NW-56]|uniref:hypothetical protein n=1 Tax=Deinococcus sp. NW-56 TaxID=2080419 RepID=UPI00131A2A82|nr:hypothetical protein [Deinococcus sp. NW-56]